jgi:anti-anti-sigma factor
MALESVWLDDELILYVEGTLDGALAPAAYLLMQQAMDAGVRSVIVDLARAELIDGGGVAVLAAAAAACEGRAARMTLALAGDLSVRVRDPSEVRAVLHIIDPRNRPGCPGEN